MITELSFPLDITNCVLGELMNYQFKLLFITLCCRFAVSGHVREVLLKDVENTPFCLLKSKVTPSMRIRDKPHEPWVYLNRETAAVYCAHCTCMAG